jgi:hypothetical protein
LATYFGNDVHTTSDGWAYDTILYNTTAYTCPGSGTQAIQELSFWCSLDASSARNLRLGVYNSAGTSLIAEGTGEVAMAGGAQAWQGHMTQASVKAAGGSSPGILVGGTSYMLAVTIENGNSPTLANNKYVGSLSGKVKENGSADYTAGMPSDLTALSTYNYNSEFALQCGVQATVVFQETFEGSNQCCTSGTNPNSCISATNSFVVHGTVSTLDFGYTTTPLEGSKSLRIIGNTTGDDGVRFVDSARNDVYGFFEYKYVTSVAGEDFFQLSTTGGTQILSLFSAAGPNIYMYDGGSYDTGYLISQDTKYYVWYEFHRNTGSSDSVFKLWVSTTTTKPGSATYSKTTGSYSQVGWHAWVTGGNVEHRFDNIYIDTIDITNYPFGVGGTSLSVDIKWRV